MTLEIVSTSSWPDHVAGLLADRVAGELDLVVCLPTGSTPLPVYDRLPSALQARGVAVADVTVVALDEFLGLPAGHPARCDEILRRRLLQRLGPAGPRSIGFDVGGLDPDGACAAFDRELGHLGGIDLVVLGLGRNGHVGMNEPGSPPDAPTRAVALAPSTREAAIGYGADPAPTHGVTLGMGAILAAREVWLLATGAAKAEVLGRAMNGPVTSRLPASLLRGHPGLRVLVDDAAAAGLS